MKPVIVLGSVLDGIPESVVLGLTVANGGVSLPFLVGVAWRYTRVADRVEQNFADHVQD